MTVTTSGLRGLALAVLASAACATHAMAQEEESSFSLGVMGLSGKTPYGFTDSGVVPLIGYENRYIRLGGPSLDLKLPWISSENLSFALRANFFTGEGYEASDDPILHGMADRDSGVWIGATVDWTSDMVDLSFEATADTGDSEGSRVRLEASRMFFLGERVTLKPRLGAVWMDDKSVDYYYGVLPGEATASRAAYEGSATVNVEAGLSIGYMLSERQMLMLDLSATRLGSGITDSPIVVEDTVTAIGLGYMFRF